MSILNPLAVITAVLVLSSVQFIVVWRLRRPPPSVQREATKIFTAYVDVSSEMRSVRGEVQSVRAEVDSQGEEIVLLRRFVQREVEGIRQLVEEIRSSVRR